MGSFFDSKSIKPSVILLSSFFCNFVLAQDLPGNPLLRSCTSAPTPLTGLASPWNAISPERHPLHEGTTFPQIFLPNELNFSHFGSRAGRTNLQETLRFISFDHVHDSSFSIVHNIAGTSVSPALYLTVRSFISSSLNIFLIQCPVRETPGAGNCQRIQRIFLQTSPTLEPISIEVAASVSAMAIDFCWTGHGTTVSAGFLPGPRFNEAYILNADQKRRHVGRLATRIVERVVGAVLSRFQNTPPSAAPNPAGTPP